MGHGDPLTSGGDQALATLGEQYRPLRQWAVDEGAVVGYAPAALLMTVIRSMIARHSRVAVS